MASVDLDREKLFSIDGESSIPAHTQIKTQLKLARTFRQLNPREALPSIRVLAKHLGLGEGVVRRSYRELCQAGVLYTNKRKHLVTPGPIPPETRDTAIECANRCDELAAWARSEGISSIGLGRLLTSRAIAQEASSPSYVFVDICRRAAEESARRAANAWETKVSGLSLRDFAHLPQSDIDRLSAVMANEYLHNETVALVSGGRPRVISVRMQSDHRLPGRIRRLRPGSRVLVIISDDSIPPGDRALLRHCVKIFGGRRRFIAEALNQVPDFAALVKSRRYGLILVCPLAWEQVPAQCTRMTSVARLSMEPEPQSLEQARISAGVLW